MPDSFVAFCLWLLDQGADWARDLDHQRSQFMSAGERMACSTG